MLAVGGVVEPRFGSKSDRFGRDEVRPTQRDHCGQAYDLDAKGFALGICEWSPAVARELGEASTRCSTVQFPRYEETMETIVLEKARVPWQP